ncbi:gamma-tubulin [Mitosporidium daphniae]
MSTEGGGAGNNWAFGYSEGVRVKDELLEMLDREAESSDSLEGFVLVHSIAGGTGSGLGSCLLEQLNEFYPKKVIQTYSVFPNSEEVLLHWLNVGLRHCRAALQFIALFEEAVQPNGLRASDRLRILDPSFLQTNQLLATVMAASSATLRFPGPMYNDLGSILSSLIPLPKCHFLSTSYTPFYSENSRIPATTNSKTSIHDVLRRLLQPKNSMMSYSSTAANGNLYLSALAVLRGNRVDTGQVFKSLLRVKERELIKFAEWTPTTLQVALSNQNFSSILSGLLLANNTGVASVFQRTIDQYDRLRKRNAFLDIYKREKSFCDILDEEFDSSRETIQSTINEYKAAESVNYLQSLNGTAIESSNASDIQAPNTSIICP